MIPYALTLYTPNPNQPDVVLFDELGHYPHLEAPELVLAAYLEFRATLRPTG